MRRRILGHKKNGIPTGNLVLYNRFDGNLTDETGNHTLSSNSISYTNGIYSGSSFESVYLSVNTHYINVPDSDLLSFGNGTSDSPFSISFAVNFDAIIFASRILTKRGDGSSGTVNKEYDILPTSSNTDIDFILHDNSTGGFLRVQTTTFSLTTGTNYFFTFTYDGSGSASGIKIYKNAVEETVYNDLSSGTYTAMENLSAPVRIGRPNFSPTNGITGKYDELGIWDKELSQEEVTAIYNKISAGNSLL